MKVCLVNPPWESEGRWGIRAGCRFPNLMLKKHNSYVPFPFLLAYTASYLEGKGVEVCLIDGVAERCSRNAFLERVKTFAPDLVLAETATTSITHDLDLLCEVKTQTPAPLIAVYGPHVSVMYEDGLRSSAVDFVIRGEPELTTYELATSLSNGQDFSKIPGLVYRTTTGIAQVNPRRPLIRDIDELPYPKRVGMPMDKYSVPGFATPVVFMYGSRGCPFRCDFCLWPQTIFEEGSYRSRSPEKIVDEMVWVTDQIPATKSFFFDDDTFNLGPQRMTRFADELQRRGITIPWGCNARADNWDRHTLRKLVQSGLFTIRIGIESGDQGVLDRTGKALNLEEAKATLRMSHELGILNHVSFVVGLQGESWDSVENTLKFIRSVPVDSVQFSVAIPFPGTRYFDYVSKHDFFVTYDWQKFNGFDHVVMRTESLSADEVMQAINHLRRRIYFSPRFIRRRLKYVRNLRDVGALARKVVRLLLHY